MQRRVWESIAQSWNRHRQVPEKPVIDFMKDRKVLLDLGCGSGRHFVSGKKYIGIDFSKEMLILAKQNAKKKKAKVHLIRSDLSALPLKAAYFNDVTLSAVLHIIESRNRRKCLKEIKRVMKKSGRALVTVWNKEQPRFSGKRKVTYVPWKTGKKKYLRYYYLFTKSELKSLLAEYFEIEYIETVSRSRPFGENIVAVVKKV